MNKDIFTMLGIIALLLIYGFNIDLWALIPVTILYASGMWRAAKNESK